MPGDHLRRWSAKDGVTTFRKPCNKSNGLTWDRQGRLLACEHASSQVTRTEPDGRIVPLATHYQGKQLNSPNDIVCAARRRPSTSAIRPTAAPSSTASPRPQELAFQGVFRGRPGSEEPGAARRRLRPAQRALLLARRPAALRQRHRPPAHPRLRREGRRHARRRQGLGGDHRRGQGRARRHEDRLARATCTAAARAASTCSTPTRAASGVIHVPEYVGQLRVGRRRLPEPLHHRVDVGVPHPDRPFPGCPPCERDSIS